MARFFQSTRCENFIESNLVSSLCQLLGHRHERDLGRLGDHRKEEEDVPLLRPGRPGSKDLVQVIFNSLVGAQNWLGVGLVQVQVLALANTGAAEGQKTSQKYQAQVSHHPAGLAFRSRMTDPGVDKEADEGFRYLV